jgi:hypothetical protein
MQKIICERCRLQVGSYEDRIRLNDQVYHSRCWDRIEGQRSWPASQAPTLSQRRSEPTDTPAAKDAELAARRWLVEHGGLDWAAAAAAQVAVGTRFGFGAWSAVALCYAAGGSRHVIRFSLSDRQIAELLARVSDRVA